MATSTQEQMSEALSILSALKENALVGRSNKLADVKQSLEGSMSNEFDSYFFFLRKFHYIAMDREAQLKLSDHGERLVDGEEVERFRSEVNEFFGEQVPTPPPSGPEITDDSASTTSPPQIPPMPPPGLDATLLSYSASSRSGLRRAEEPLRPTVTAPENRPAGGPLVPPPPPPAPVPLTAVVPSSSPSGFGIGATPKGQDLDQRYTKNEQVGTGPLGTVYRAKHLALNMDVCVKELKDIFGYFSFLQRSEVVKRLKKEICAQAQMRHPGVVQIFDQNTDTPRPYFVMELCRGHLREKLDAASGQGLPAHQAIRYFLQLAYALRAGHQQGLTHHNLKPENVLFDVWGNAKLADFGLSRVIEVDQNKGMPQVFVGTGGMGYMSPELIGRARDTGASADVYGLGIMLYEMLTGQLPGRRSPLPSEVNNEIPAALDSIFDKMTQDKRETRYADFDAVLADFYRAFEGQPYLEPGDLILRSESLTS